jgi:type III secretion system FlhB-like substrate exporter
MQKEKPETDAAVSDHKIPAECYEVVAQIMIFLQTADEDYPQSKA